MNPADADLIIWWLSVTVLVVGVVVAHQIIAAIARREIRKAMKGYTMMRTVQPRDERGRFRRGA